MTFLLVSGVFDLSVGSVMVLSGYVIAALVVKDVPLFISCLTGLLTGVFAGYINGKIITFFGVNPLIMTFGMMSIARGIALAATQGQTVRVFDGAFINLGKGEIFGLNQPRHSTIIYQSQVYEIFVDQLSLIQFLVGFPGSRHPARILKIQTSLIYLIHLRLQSIEAG